MSHWLNLSRYISCITNIEDKYDSAIKVI